MVAAAMSPDFSIHSYGEVPTDIMRLPWQHLKQEVEGIGKRARFKQVTSHRTLLRGANAKMDEYVLKQALAKQAPEEANWLTNILDLGRWSSSRLGDFQQDNDGTCVHCGQADADLLHLLWDCTCLDKERYEDDSDLRTLRRSMLPANWQLGIPGALHAEEDEFLWPVPDPTEVSNLPGFAKAHRKCQLHPEARGLLQARGQHERALNARQYVASKKVAPYLLQPPMPGPCDETAPDEPNVFTDGSLKHPACQHWSLGGMGVWWPSRNLQDHPLSDMERNFSVWEVGENCLSLWGAITGARCSSLRTELSAGILAASGPGPAHQATDSKAYQVKVNKMLAGQNLTAKKPWSLQPDGDLWSIMEDAIRMKGRASLRVTWTKGHATEEHFAKGTSSPLLKLGNDTADKVADRGVLDHCGGLFQLVHYYSSKQRYGKDLLVRIHNMFIRVLKADKVKRELQ